MASLNKNIFFVCSQHLWLKDVANSCLYLKMQKKDLKYFSYGKQVL